MKILKYCTLGLITIAVVLAAAFFLYKPSEGIVTGQPEPQIHYTPSQIQATLNQKIPLPIARNIAYGPHDRHKIDFWHASSVGKSVIATPLAIFVHGGGFEEGDKGDCIEPDKSQLLAQGISVSCINYRFMVDAPLPEILRDVARAVQYFRYRADDFNILPQKIAVYGDSAGASAALWLATIDDLAIVKSPDPILRESTRVVAAAGIQPQATYNFMRWPDILDIPHAAVWLTRNSHFKYFLDLHINLVRYDYFKMGETQAGRNVRAFLDITDHMDKSDPPLLFYSAWHAAKINDLLHHPKHSDYIEKTCLQVGAQCTKIISDTLTTDRDRVIDFLITQLKK